MDTGRIGGLTFSARRSAVLVFALAALGGFAGCGDDDDNGGGAGDEVVLNEPVAVTADDPDPEATEEPSGVEVLEELEALQRAEDSDSVPAIRGSAGLTVPEWIHAVNADVTLYWQQQFNAAGYSYELPDEVIFDSRVRTACGKARPSFGPFYCSFDEAIYLPVQFFEMAAGRFGDAAVALVIAHENGHHVQQRLGLFDAGLLTAQTELQADCLAGAWAYSVYQRGLIEEGDIGEILGLTEISGDLEGTPIDTPGAHGSSELRLRFFNQGYTNGNPDACPPPAKSEISG